MKLFWLDKSFLIILAINIFLFLFYLSISIHTPYQADDFIFKINPMNTDLTLVNLNKAFQFQWETYNIWSGRAVGIFFITLFLIQKKIVFDIINSILQITLINIIFYLAYNRIAKNIIDAATLLFINILLYFGFYNYNSVSMYITATINITWMAIFVFTYYIIFVKKISSNNISISANVLFFIFGIFVGCTNEQVFIAQLSFFLILYILNKTGQYPDLPNLFHWSFIGVLIGGLVLILAPGNYVRLEFQGGTLTFDFNRMLNYLKFEMDFLFNVIKPLWFVFLPLIIAQYYIFKSKLKINKQNLVILVVGCISSFVMIFSPGYHNGTNLFFFYCLLITCLSVIDFRILNSIFPKNSFLFSQIILSIMLQFYIVSNQINIFNYAKKLESEILERKGDGEMDIKVKPIELKTNRFIIYHNLHSDENSPRNQGVAKYYGIHSIKVVDNNL